MVTQDQYVGRYQVPVADCAVTSTALNAITGEAMAMGERAPVALINPAASARLAVAEAVTNIASARIDKISDITLSANWMAACGDEKKMRHYLMRFMRWAKSYAQHLVLPFQWAKTAYR